MATVRKAILSALLLSALICGGALPARAAEVIESFHSDIDLAQSGQLTVTETIQVNAEQDRIRHGIYRDFPLTFTGDDGTLHRVDFKILGVTRDGQPEDYRSQSIDNGTRILIGNAEEYVSTGQHSYEIRYETGRQIRYFPSHEELFWNVTGNGWQFPINEATATVILPPGVKPDATAFFTGELGATGKNARATTADGRVFFATTRPLDVHEGLTIGVKFAKGTILPPTDSDRFRWAMHDWLNSIITGICLLVVFAYFAIQWFRIGRDPARGVTIPRWDAPAGLSPALVNYVAHRGFNNGGWTAFSASAIDLAIKGLITLEDLKTSVTLKATGNKPDGALPLGEDKIYTRVKSASTAFAINKVNGEAIQSLGEQFRTAIDKEHSGKYYRFNLGAITLGVLLTIAACFAILIFSDFTEDMLGLLGMPALVFIFVAVFTRVLAASALSSPAMIIRLIGWTFISIFWLAFAMIIFVSILSAMETARSPDDTLAYIACCAMLLVAGFFTTFMGAATPLGRQLSDGIEGLRLYLTVAEKDRMNFAGAPEMSPRHFEKLLPYAVALGVEKPWSEHFQKWLDAAGTAAQSYQPAWYAGQNFNSQQFGQRMSGFSSSLSSTISASLPTPPPSSSSGFSSSGGGSSGSGGGGGGGGGW